jgi:hypothetical protein
VTKILADFDDLLYCPVQKVLIKTHKTSQVFIFTGLALIFSAWSLSEFSFDFIAAYVLYAAHSLDFFALGSSTIAASFSFAD